MDSFINLAKQGLSKYENEGQKEGQQQQPQSVGYGRTGGEEYNSPDHNNGGRPHGGAPSKLDLDDDNVVNTAQNEGSGDNELFSQGLSFIKSQMGGGSPPATDIDEDGVKDAHDKAYNQSNTGNLPASSLGAAAALQAFKKFTSGDSGASNTSSSSSGGGGIQSKLIGMAMAEASKLFDSQGSAGGNKQDAVNGAAQMAMKLLLKQQMSSMIGGGNSGGLSGLAGLAKNFI